MVAKSPTNSPTVAAEAKGPEVLPDRLKTIAQQDASPTHTGEAVSRSYYQPAKIVPAPPVGQPAGPALTTATSLSSGLGCPSRPRFQRIQSPSYGGRGDFQFNILDRYMERTDGAGGRVRSA